VTARRRREPIDRLIEPLERFLHVEAAGGAVLLACTLAALVLAASPLSDSYLAIWKSELGVRIGGVDFHHSLKHWINDGLMAIFFFVIGLEVKRELVLGELRDPRRAALPVFAAVGGMVAPAAIYLLFQAGEPGARGWGIPMATDIAFVVGCMAMLGPRVPHGLRIMILSLAIADDIGAILVIAIGYTESLNLAALGLGGLGLAGVFALSRLGVRSFAVYTVAGALVWLAFHESGIHATVAGVILGLMTPAHSRVGHGVVAEAIVWLREMFEGGGLADARARAGAVREVQRAARETVSPLEYLEAVLHPWVGFAIMPLFALANAGVAIRLSDFADPVALAVTAGLVVGKPVGIVAASWLAVRSGLARLPDGVGWPLVAGGGALAGIGFTMALFIAGLALEGELLKAAKVGVLGASAVSAILGVALLALAHRRSSP
jgi:NhaA family Na+:H+ antiporter